MPDIVTAVDEVGANTLIAAAITALGTVTTPPSSRSLGPFSVSWIASATFSGGNVDIIPPPPDVLRIGGRVNYSVALTLSLDLSFLNFCLPQICIDIPFIGRVCTPQICLTFPTISVPVSHSSTVDFAADGTLAATLAAGVWTVEAVVVAVPTLVLGPAAAALILVIGTAVTAALLLVPFIGPLLALASAVILGAFSLANVLGLLGAIITPFIAGRRFTLFQQSQLFEIMPPDPPDPAVFVSIDAVTPTLDGSGGEDEFIISIDIS